MMDEFKTIRDDTSDVLFSLRHFEPPNSPVANTAQTPRNGGEIVQQVLHSARLRNALTGIAEKEGVSVEDVFEEARQILEDIGHTFTLTSIRFVAYFIRKVFRNIYTGIKVNVAGMKKVKELSKEFPVVLVPSHRSYADFLLVSFVCFILDLPLPVIAAAQDFKNMTMIGGMLQSCGAFYMKRSFRSDELYWTVFFEYVQCLALNSGTTMEFFLEGTRSRSGKSLHPKQGLLSILTDLYFTSRVPDVMFCPVGISYDRVLEETLLARELLGVPKPTESLRGLLKARSVLSEDYGFAYLYFGEPISLREFVGGYETRMTKTTIPRCVRNDPNHEELQIVRKLGKHIMKRIQDHLIILPNMVVASILLQNPTGIKLEALIQQYASLTGSFRKCDIYVVENEGDTSQSAVMESLQLLKSSLILTEDNTVCLLDSNDFSPDFKNYISTLLTRNKPNCEDDVNDINKDRKVIKMSDLCVEEKDYVLELSCTHLQLAHQRNQLLHWFYLPAMVVLTRCSRNIISQETFYNDTKMLGDILCLEIGREEFLSKEDFFQELDKFKALGISKSNDEQYEIKPNEVLSFVENLWHPLLTAYWVVYSYIFESCSEGTEYIPDEVVHHCQDFAASLFLQGVVNYLEIQSLEVLKNGLKSLQRLHIVQQLKHHADKRVVVVNKTALYNLVVTVGNYLGLSYDHPAHALASKL